MTDAKVSYPDELLGTLVPSVRIKNQAAAAVASIHRVQRGKTWHHAAFRREALISAREEAGEEQGQRQRPPFERDYRQGLAHIRATRHELFTATGPSMRRLHQGPLGDCFLIGTVGAVVARDPNQLRAMIGQRPGGGFVVRFPGDAPVDVPSISDAEIALGSADGDQGLWLNVIEKAFGEIVLARRGFDEPAIDALSGTGTSTQTIRLFTGREGHALRFRPRGSPHAPRGAEHAEVMTRARALLIETQQQRRLTCCATSHAATPPGVSPNHIYAILRFDPTTELVHVWNPHGNAFTPKGLPGLEAGYPVQDGFFEVPLADFVRIFVALTYESNRPAPASLVQHPSSR